MTLTPNPERLEELSQAVDELAKAVKVMRHLHSEVPAQKELKELWHVVQRVDAAAFVEHARLLGVDVSIHEARLEAKGWAVWRDLITVSTDDETVAQPRPEVSGDAVEGAALPQSHMFVGEDSHLYVAVPFDDYFL